MSTATAVSFTIPGHLAAEFINSQLADDTRAAAAVAACFSAVYEDHRVQGADYEWTVTVDHVPGESMKVTVEAAGPSPRVPVVHAPDHDVKLGGVGERGVGNWNEAV